MTNFPQALLIDLLQPDVVRRYSAYPERLEETVLGSQQKQIIIDEIQHVPELLNVVHRLIEQKRGWQFILTGSSARKLRRTGVNLLAGRAIVRHLHPFMAAELGSNFDLTTALQSGLLPVVT
ncbi:AAA family ATPase [Coxiella burnetii]|nr:AAA family ATPase [Coxiella burnetii]MCF2094743.1 AAA family ATPase [Coxiella burnetii]MCF2096792.1 AAA family ATPase [Coxiella burnetii]MCF2098817.1 AAA family ATPase [Coxiella burnetii]MCF2102894.1 AAA family ATPase [Coxiella burnetii]MCF2104927.1 AAA family ATPase [Coxiella burnetii]